MGGGKVNTERNSVTVQAQVFGYVWQSLAMFGHVWKLLATFGHVWPCLATFGHAQFGHVWPHQILATFGHECTALAPEARTAKHGQNVVFGYVVIPLAREA